ncbi:glycoside hydrolase family 95-like protein [Actinoplanes utahensis]|uniref:Alpha fucosidase A-like C-terminal domain-containing protein n=1 Tax=Actinoplanes utahensis TaxID=1869 RepID=A0A0A6UP27_ACTUT|nr:hypothetical protein [Actinoplanes utahensis]KHD77890.1 hypothetical protein MB27_08975 [Actinoplanes utahensis]GIF32408.1 hypothetical protein Aut01nite_53940 [Actinoplanes utahensis]
MPGLERRVFLRGLAAAGFAATAGAQLAGGGAAWANGVTPATAAGGAAGDPCEAAVRDATMLWTRPPTGWADAPVLGDGELTAQVWTTADGTGLVFALSGAGVGWDRPAARFTLPLSGTLTAVRWQLNPWNAELTGTVTTTRGNVGLTLTVPHGTGTLLAGLDPRGGERGDAAPAADGATAGLGWRDRWEGGRRWLFFGDPKGLPAGDPRKLLTTHRDWWHRYYGGSFVSVPDKTLQRFHWLQVYTAASTARSDAAGGLDTPSILSAVNHLERHPAVSAAGDGGWPQGLDHVLFAMPGAGLKAGDAENPILAWNLPELWDSYRYGAGERVLRDVLRPMLRSAVIHYEDSLVPGADGRLHLPMTYSPGYGDVEDATYDLALLRWAAGRLEQSAAVDPAGGERDRWRALLDRLTPYHTDETGVLIGAGVRLSASQPRPAHLLWMHPLGEKVWARADDRAVMRRSLEHWASMPEAWDGRSYLSAAAMAAGTRAPGEALGHLHRVLDGTEHAGTRLSSAALFSGGGAAHSGATFEAAQVTMRLLLSADTDDVVDLFPALPEQWRDASVSGLRAPGSFVVDASRSDGRTDWVRVRSEAGRPLVLRHGIAGEVDVRDDAGRPVAVRQLAPGVLTGDLRTGEAIVVRPAGAPVAEIGVRDVPALGTARQWGLSGADRVAALL